MSFSCARALSSLALAASIAASCSRTHAPTSTSDVTALAHSADVVLAESPLHERMRLAPTTVRHGGTRRLEVRYDVAGVTHSMRYEERVTADGTGRFALDPLRIVEPAMTPAQHEVFELVQKNREGFMFHFRDFGVRQRELFLANYRVIDLHTNPVIAGRVCKEFEVQRLSAAQVKYRLAVDVQTALVLRSIEIAPNGTEVARSEFTDFTLDPVLDNVAWFTPRYGGTPLDETNFAASGLTFQPHVPRLLPPGYQHLHSEVLTDDSNQRWVRHVYSDGVESLLVLEKGSLGDARAQTAEAQALSRGKSPQESSSTPAPAAPYKVRLMNAGAWVVAEVARGESQLFVVGKISEGELLRALQSVR